MGWVYRFRTRIYVSPAQTALVARPRARPVRWRACRTRCPTPPMPAASSAPNCLTCRGLDCSGICGRGRIQLRTRVRTPIFVLQSFHASNVVCSTAKHPSKRSLFVRI